MVWLDLNDNDIQSPQFFRERLNGIRKASGNLSRKQRGSKNRQKERMELARLHRKLQNQLSDFYFKLAHDLTDRYNVMSFETLNLKGMQRMRGRKINDLVFANLISILKYAASSKGKTVVFTDR